MKRNGQTVMVWPKAKRCIEPQPEASATMHQAVFAAPERAGGPCREQPVTVALSLGPVGIRSRDAGSRLR